MSNAGEWPPKEKGRMDKVVKEILAKPVFKELLSRYTAERLEYKAEINDKNIAEKIAEFRKRYDSREAFQNEPKVPVDEYKYVLKNRYEDVDEAISEFEDLMFGPVTQEVRASRPKFDQEADTQEFIVSKLKHSLEVDISNMPPQVPSADFKYQPHSIVEAKQAEFKRDTKELVRRIRESKQFSGLIAEFLFEDFDMRGEIQKNPIKYLPAFFDKFPKLEDLEGGVRVESFLNTIKVNKEDGTLDEEETISRRANYVQYIAEFEDMSYGYHKER